MNPLPSQRPSIQLILAALAFLTGVIILIARFGGSLSAPQSTVARATEALPLTTPSATPSLTSTATPTVAPTAPAATPTAAPTATPTAAPAATPAVALTAAPTILLSTATPTASLVPSSPSPTPAATMALPTPTATPTPPTPTATFTAIPAQLTATPTTTPTVVTVTVTATPSPTPGVRTLTLLVDGTQPQVEISYEIGDTEVVVGNAIVPPWFKTIEVAFDLDVRLIAAGTAEFGDVRCQITGDAVPTPGIVDYDSNPYPSVECVVVGQ